MSELLLVAVPGGTVEGGKAVLRVLVVPRLEVQTPTPLREFGLADWPAVLRNSTLGLEVGATIDDPGRPLEATTLNRGSTDVWQSFFAENMTANPRQQRVYGQPAVVRTSDQAAKIVKNYRASAAAFAAPGENASQVVREQYAEWRDDADPAGTAGELTPGEWQVPDFHRAVSLLREHSAVLKELGLIVELSIALDALHGVPAELRLIRVTFTSAEAGFSLTPVNPWTRYEFDGRRFLPAPHPDGDLRRGMVDLSAAGLVTPAGASEAAKWSLATFDVDGGVGRLREGARTALAAPDRDTSSDISLPVLHSAGLGLIRRGREESLRRRASNTVRDNTRAGLLSRELWADDLVLGYRIDIKEQTSGRWRSLCRRLATYYIDERMFGSELQPEEGHVKANAVVLGEDKVVRSNEVVARWTGWNLAIPRPVFDEQGKRLPDARRPEMPFNFKWDFTNPTASLPRLRFGWAYQMRARVADMAGGGLKVEDDPTSEEMATTLVPYHRHEPIPPPEVAPPPGMFTTNAEGVAIPDPKALGPGGTIDLLIIRSDPNADTPLDLQQFAQVNPGYPRNDLRTIVAPPTSMAIAEQHDALNGGDETTWNWARRTTMPPVVATDGTYSWLPDPAAIGVRAFVRRDPASPAAGASGASNWIGNWPDHQPKTVQLHGPEPGRPVMQWTATAGAGLPQDTDALLVHLKPAEQVDIEVSCYPRNADLDKFEIRSWIPEADALLISGRHPMMTPPRVLQLVHAVRRPLKQPAGRLVAERIPGAAWSLLKPGDSDTLVGIDPASTSQVDITGEWYETFDRVQAPNETFTLADPAPPHHTEHVTSLTIERAALTLPELRHEFGDTRHRRVRYTLTALSRFRQFFDPDIDTAFQTQARLEEVVIPSSARPAPPVVLAATPAFRWEGSNAAPGLAQPVRRKRLGGRIRAELARPWHISGQDERLAVIVKPPGSAPDQELDRHFTKLLRDPIWATEAAAGFAQQSMFEGMAAPAEECLLTEAEGKRGLAIPFPAHFDPDGDRWYADIHMPGGAGNSYSPFVRLVVARYQRESVDGHELSSTVTTDFVQLLPDRTLSIDRVEGDVRVLLEGRGPTGPRRNRVTVLIERCLPGGNSAVSDLTSASPDIPGLWHRLDGHSVWGFLGEPLPPLSLPEADGLLRIVVREIEDIPAAYVEDDGVLATDLRQRTVFLDIIRI